MKKLLFKIALTLVLLALFGYTAMSLGDFVFQQTHVGRSVIGAIGNWTCAGNNYTLLLALGIAMALYGFYEVRVPLKAWRADGRLAKQFRDGSLFRTGASLEMSSEEEEQATQAVRVTHIQRYHQFRWGDTFGYLSIRLSMFVFVWAVFGMSCHR